MQPAENNQAHLDPAEISPDGLSPDSTPPAEPDGAAHYEIVTSPEDIEGIAVPEPDEGELIVRAQSGEDGAAEAFGVVFARHAAELRRSLRGTRPEDRDDILQEAAFRAFRGIGSLALTERGPLPWLIRITQNTARDFHRLNQRRPTTVSFDAQSGGSSLLGIIRGKEDTEDSALIGCAAATALTELAATSAIPGAAHIIQKIVLEGMPYGQYSETFDVRLGTVRSRLSRAKAELGGIVERLRREGAF